MNAAEMKRLIAKGEGRSLLPLARQDAVRCCET